MKSFRVLVIAWVLMLSASLPAQAPPADHTLQAHHPHRRRGLAAYAVLDPVLEVLDAHGGKIGNAAPEGKA